MKTVLKVTGMSCANCVKHVGDALRAIPGVSHVDVALAEGRATIEHDGRSDTQQLSAAVEEAGYGAALLAEG